MRYRGADLRRYGKYGNRRGAAPAGIADAAWRRSPRAERESAREAAIDAARRPGEFPVRVSPRGKHDN
jgi:hypothetical protein